MSDQSAIFLFIITFIFPPIGVYMIHGLGADFLINIILTSLGFVPGHIHAFYLEFKYYSHKEDVRISHPRIVGPPFPNNYGPSVPYNGVQQLVQVRPQQAVLNNNFRLEGESEIIDV